MTKALGLQDTTELHQKLNDARDWVQLEGADNWFFGGVLGAIADALNAVVLFFQELISIPAFPRPVPEIGWLGVVALGAWITYAFAGLRSTILVTATLLFFGVVDLWSDSMDTLIITLLAVVICMVIGIPLGIWMARSKPVSNSVTPVLDIMQTFPPFCYLAPLALFFGIGSACALVLTIIYALPPIVRITEHGIRSVSPTTQEAARSLGLTGGQMLRSVQLPMARRTIVVGINQCMMAALSMATIAALVNGPGLGKPVVSALQTLNVGAASVAGLAIVFMAIMLDRTTTAASERGSGRTNVGSASGMGVMLTTVVLERLPRWATEEAGRGQRLPRVTTAGRWLLLSVLFIPVAVCVYLSRQQLNLAVFPDVSETPVLKWISGPELTRLINEFTDWFVGNVDTFTIWVKDQVTVYLINPLQDLLAQSPWWVMAIVLLAVAYVLGGWRPAAITVVCEAVIFWTGLWNDTMVTLSMTLIATALVMLIAVVLGVAMGRSRRADVSIRPFLDAVPGDPAVRLPRAGPRPVRARTLHRHHGRHGVRRPDRHQAGRRRHSRRLADDGRGRAVHRQHPLADDLQGPAADGARVAGAGHQPGPALRAVDGRHRRHGRRRQPRLHRRLGLLAGPAVRQGPRRRHRDRGARRHARPDRPLRSGAVRALMTTTGFLRGGRGGVRRERAHMARGSRHTRLVALAQSQGSASA